MTIWLHRIYKSKSEICRSRIDVIDNSEVKYQGGKIDWIAHSSKLAIQNIICFNAIVV